MHPLTISTARLNVGWSEEGEEREEREKRDLRFNPIDSARGLPVADLNKAADRCHTDNTTPH